MKTELCLKSIEAQLDRIQWQIENAQRSLTELEFMLIEAKLRKIKK